MSLGIIGGSAMLAVEQILANKANSAQAENFATLMNAQVKNLGMTTAATIQSNALKTLSNASTTIASTYLEMQSNDARLVNKIQIS